MLHVVHRIERRFGARAVKQLLAGSLLLLILGLGLLLVSGRVAAQQLATVDGADIATRLLDHLDAGRYTQAEAMFDANMAKAVPASTLTSLWNALPAQAGALQRRGTAVVTPQGDVTLVTMPLHYAKTELVAKIAVGADGKIAGFLIQPAETRAAATPVPAHANFSERDFSVGDGASALPGTLAMPRHAGSAAAPKVAAVVLVHGSGPQDRDETVGPNKPFLDIARGLAAQGIAVLRYDKRTKARPQDFADGVFGIDDETTADAVRAVAALRGSEGIDPTRVFVLGHSQGGMMAPRIAAKSGHVAGLVLMAAPARSLLDIVIEQNRRLALLGDDQTSDMERAAIDALVEQVRITRDANTAPATKTVMGLSAGYWRSVDAVDAVAEARALTLPMLVLHGARDIQVVDADWQRWRGAFAADTRVAFRQYATLNHLGIAGEGDGNLVEYYTPGHVDATLIDDVANWIKAH